MLTETWTAGPPWAVPQEWPGERCFILCSGPSLQSQLKQIPKLKGRFIAVKHGVLARPDADVLFLSGERDPSMSLGLIPHFKGKHMIVRSRPNPLYPPEMHWVTRTKNHDELCPLPDHVAGLDCGTSAINIAYHFGATEIVMLGYDLTGGHFCKHPLQNPPQQHHDRHLAALPKFAEDAKRKGIRIVNCSPISAITVFERQPLEAFL